MSRQIPCGGSRQQLQYGDSFQIKFHGSELCRPGSGYRTVRALLRPSGH
jgi:hypothetical protein